MGGVAADGDGGGRWWEESDGHVLNRVAFYRHRFAHPPLCHQHHQLRLLGFNSALSFSSGRHESWHSISVRAHPRLSLIGVSKCLP